MNTTVRADTLTVGFVATMINVTVSTEKILLPNSHIITVDTVCPSLFYLSLNGHSISGVNPENSLIGGMTTLIAA